jgi:hypothetical protein
VPKIPTYGTDLIDQAPLPGVRQTGGASADMFYSNNLGALAKGLGNASDALFKMQEREDADMIFRAETALKDDYLKYERSVRDRIEQELDWLQEAIEQAVKSGNDGNAADEDDDTGQDEAEEADIESLVSTLTEAGADVPDVLLEERDRLRQRRSSRRGNH